MPFSLVFTDSINTIKPIAISKLESNKFDEILSYRNIKKSEIQNLESPNILSAVKAVLSEKQKTTRKDAHIRLKISLLFLEPFRRISFRQLSLKQSV